MAVIIPESPDHYPAIRQVTIDAFEASELGYGGEADLIDAVRRQCKDFLSLVALEDDKVVGHLLFSPATIHSGSAILQGMALAPMTVLSARQRKGIGAALVEEGLRRVEESDARFVIVLGHPDYYPRFGFRPAAEFSVVHGFEGIPQELLFLRPVAGNGPPGVIASRVFFSSVFGQQFSE